MPPLIGGMDIIRGAYRAQRQGGRSEKSQHGRDCSRGPRHVLNVKRRLVFSKPGIRFISTATRRGTNTMKGKEKSQSAPATGLIMLRVSSPFLVRHTAHVEADPNGRLRGLPWRWRAWALVAGCGATARDLAAVVLSLAAAAAFDAVLDAAVSNGLVVSPSALDDATEKFSSQALSSVLKLLFLHVSSCLLSLARAGAIGATRNLPLPAPTISAPFAVKHVVHVEEADKGILEQHATAGRGEISAPFNVEHKLHIDANFQVSTGGRPGMNLHSVESPILLRSVLRPLG